MLSSLPDVVTGQPIRTDTFRTLRNILKSYEESDHVEILINEIIANGLDAFLENSMIRGEIEVELKKTNSEKYYLQFHNNAPPMNRSQFMKYHEVSVSEKKAGFSIGYAGVGAKLFIGDGGEITTITGTDNQNMLASKMWSENEVALMATSEEYPILEIITDPSYRHVYEIGRAHV